MTEPPAWTVTSRIEELRGEQRANVLRVVGVAVFYAIEVVSYHGVGPFPRVEGIDNAYHAMATALAAAWIALAASVLIALRFRAFPPALKYLSTGGDVFLMSAVLVLADGPRSPLLLGYLLLIALAGMRLSAPLVWFATICAVLGYGFVLFDVAARRPELAVPEHWVATTLSAIVLSGVVVAQILAGVERAARKFAALEQRGEERAS